MSFENPNGFVHEEERDEVLEVQTHDDKVTIKPPRRKHKKLAPLDKDSDNDSIKKMVRHNKVGHIEKQVAARNPGVLKFLQVTSILEIFLSFLIIILNILFIFYGMNSGWYYFVDSLGTELKVISIGEGIIAGFFYIIFASVFLVKLASADLSNTVLYAMNSLILILTVVLAIANACQLGLVNQYMPRSGQFPDTEVEFMVDSENKQSAVLGVQLGCHLLILLCAVGSSVAIPQIWQSTPEFIN